MNSAFLISIFPLKLPFFFFFLSFFIISLPNIKCHVWRTVNKKLTSDRVYGISPWCDLCCCSVQFSSVPWPIWVVGGWGTIQQRSSSSLLQTALVSRSGMGRDVHSLKMSIHYFFCRSRRRPSSKVPWMMVWRGCRGVWHAQIMQVSVSWQLPEEVPEDPRGSWSCCIPSHSLLTGRYISTINRVKVHYFLRTRESHTIMHV